MGYTTDFRGDFILDRPLKPQEKKYLEMFSDSRRIARDITSLTHLPTYQHTNVGLTLGTEGEFYVEDDSIGITNYNVSPSTQPGLWCQWIPNEDGTSIEWSGTEKFHDYVTWIEYIITNFLLPWGYTLNGKVWWKGEDVKDRGTITIKDNVVKVVGKPY